MLNYPAGVFQPAACEGRKQRKRKRLPMDALPSNADILLRCREPPQWARIGLSHCK
jgi:hypothetical protein